MIATSYRNVLLSLLVLAGCDRAEVPADAGRDAGGATSDAATADASIPGDASTMLDAAAPDAAMRDGAMDDGSASDASVEPDATTNTCGDGVMGGDEECDDGAANSDTAADACRTDCTLAGCGDGVSDTGETCDTDDLGGRTCADEGFAGGALACAATCDGYDTSLCSTCGDGTIDGADQCDGADLGGRTCADELGTGAIGEVVCRADCTFDASACTLCGNGALDAGEACDGALLGGAVCPEGGTISCTATCTLDMSACISCGDGAAEGAEACDGGDLRGETCASRPGFMSGVLACDAACAFDETMCSAAAPVTAVGQIVISEIMQNPSALPDGDGEWFEVHNPGAAPLELAGCLVSSAGGVDDRFTIDESVIVPAGGYATFAVSSTTAGAPGFTPDYRWTTAFNLGNSGDTVTITCGGTPIDTVVYDGGTVFPDPNGASMNLSSTALSTTANDVGGSWCESTTTFGGGATPDRGTPGAANEACPSYTVMSCRLETPPTITADIGTSHPVDGRVHVAGLTTLTTGNDPSPFIRGAVGFGPDGSDPATSSGWTWIAASPRAGWVDTAEVGSDEYRAMLVAPGPAGSYDYAYRFSADGGATWVYCDTGSAGSTDGYQVANAGALTTTGTGPAALYFSEYLEGSSDNKALEIHNPGTASADLSMCSIRLYSNGASSPSRTLALAGSLAAGDVLLACHAMISPSVTGCDVSAGAGSVMEFNGDDAIELFCAGTTLDVIGVIGTDPGTAWTGGGVTTVNQTLRRQCTVTIGDPSGSDAFDPSVEWTELAQDTFDGLGARGCTP